MSNSVQRLCLSNIPDLLVSISDNLKEFQKFTIFVECEVEIDFLPFSFSKSKFEADDWKKIAIIVNIQIITSLQFIGYIIHKSPYFSFI